MGSKMHFFPDLWQKSGLTVRTLRSGVPPISETRDRRLRPTTSPANQVIRVMRVIEEALNSACWSGRGLCQRSPWDCRERVSRAYSMIGTVRW
jgi:hypothetical protein